MNQGNSNRLHELPLERIETTIANPGCIVFTFLAIFVIISCGGIIIFWLAYRHGLNMGLAALRVLQPPREEPLPTRFMINNSYFIPKRQYNLNIAFTFSVTYLLEAYYRFNGIDKKYLNSNQYLQISQEILAKTLIDLCKSNTLNKTHFCVNRENPDNLITLSSYFGDQAVFPSELKLETLDTKNKSDLEVNPLKFSVSDIQIFSGVSTTKRSLLISDQPHIMTMPMPMARFWFPCNDDSSNKICNERLFRCQYNLSKFCYYVDFPVEADFFNLKSDQLVAGPSQSQILIGYNDNFIPHQSYSNSNLPIGGFLIKNCHGEIGHSINYLMGEISNQEENEICPNPKNIFYWIPATLQCAKENSYNISNCNKNIHVRSGEKKLWGATELTCINETYCQKGDKYVLLSDENNSASYGTLLTGTQYAKVIKLDDCKIVEIDKLPIQFLYMAFLPTVYGKAKEEYCGHLFYSYDSMNLLSSRISTTTENWRVINAKIKWLKRSYPSTYHKYDYTYVINSLRNISYPNKTNYINFEL